MTADREVPPVDVSRLEEVFLSALEVEPSERGAFVLDACGEDEHLRRAVERLLVAHEGAREQITAMYAEAVAALAADSPLSDEPPAPLPSEIGGYRVLELLGEGGMGIVYQAEQPSPRRLVALKVVRPGVATPRMLRRFEHEAEILGRLQHPGIARIVEAGTARVWSEDLPFFAMDLVEGLPLTSYVEQRGLSTRERVELLIKVCEAVGYAHRRGVVHRDLKPGNILVDASGQPRVLDFGLARVLDSDLQATTRYSDLGELAGTVRYMSPEQFAGDRHEIDTRSDIYSLAVIAHEVLSGRHPHDLEGKPIHEVARIIEEEPPRSLSSVRPALPVDLATVVGKALRKEAERRYATAEELAEDFRRVLDRRPVKARPPSTVYQLIRFSQRHRALVAGILAAAAALIVGAIISALFAIGEARERRVAERQRDEILRLADSKRLVDYRKEADAFRLWPQLPEKRAAMEEWIARAESLSKNLSLHRESLRRLEEKPASSEAELWQADVLRELVAGIEEFAGAKRGGLASVRRRIEVAARSAGEWERARRSIADPEECPAYGGLALPVLDGLVPLGKNPDTGLWEFLHFLEGATPRRGPDGRWIEPLRSALVLVLLPGGRFPMGGSFGDPYCDGDELPPHEVSVDPFFCSKYEVTQGQWISLMGQNPSKSLGEQRPVDFVTWEESKEFCRRAGLDLPTEAEWEYACRAGTHTRFTFGDSLSSRDVNFKGTRPFPEDGKPGVFRASTLPVDTLSANRFGLHHIHGNLWEWCEDRFNASFYPKPEASWRNPICLSGMEDRILRGGGFLSAGRYVRSSTRNWADPRLTAVSRGLRPVRRFFPALGAARLMGELVARAEGIFDPRREPDEKLERMAAWLADSKRLKDEVASASRELEVLGARNPPSYEARHRRQALEEILHEAERFFDPRGGLAVRMELLEAITRSAEELWAVARASIADPARCPAYRGLEIPPQLGFAPLRSDPESGLWIFAHFFGLEIPRRDASGRLDMTDLRLRSTTTLRFVLLPGGTFAMGSSDSDPIARADEQPRHEVQLGPFLMARFEVSVAQWRDVMRYRPPRGNIGGHPVERVNWLECRAFLEKTGLSFPTEAEWEYACRAGSSAPFWTGEALTTEEALFDGPRLPATPPPVDPEVRTLPVDAFSPNRFGLYNLHGNVAEWCADVYRKTFYAEPEATLKNPGHLEVRSDEPGMRVIRGGGWNSKAPDARAAARRGEFPGKRLNGVGFRPAREVRR